MPRILAAPKRSMRFLLDDDDLPDVRIALLLNSASFDAMVSTPLLEGALYMGKLTLRCMPTPRRGKTAGELVNADNRT